MSRPEGSPTENLFITDLDENTPSRTDPVAEGADRIREIKAILRNTFPYANSALTVSNDAVEEAVRNSIPDLSKEISGIQNDIQEIKQRLDKLEG